MKLSPSVNFVFNAVKVWIEIKFEFQITCLQSSPPIAFYSCFGHEPFQQEMWD